MTGVRQLVPYSGVQTALPIDQKRRAERALAVARAFIAVCALAAITLSPVSGEPHRQISYSILAGYVVFAFGVVVLLGVTPTRWKVSALAMHVVDLSVAGGVTFFSSGTSSPFFVLFLFTLLAAAYRWGFAETLATAGAAVSLLVVEAVLLALMPDVLQGSFEPDRLIMRLTYVVLAAVLTGYLAQSEKQFRGEATAIAAILSRADARAGLKPTMTAVFDSLLQLFGAKRALLVVRENSSNQVFLWEANRSGAGTTAAIHFANLEPNNLATYMFAPEAAAWHAVRLRASASAIERGRIARELHDGVIQTVAGVEIQVAALGLRIANESPSLGQELGRLHTTLRQEGARLRDFMQQMRPLDLDSDKLVDALADFVQRFERDTGIGARFVTQLDRVALTPRACREVARILEEALVNVRRHSGARTVYVRLSTVNGDCRLSIDDDGCGFPFRGRLSQADLDASRKGPMVINERVRQIGGALTVESDPGRGARLEIAVPLSHYANHR